MPSSTSARSIGTLVGSFLLMILALFLPAGATQTGSKPPAGARLFAKTCAPCHGPDGKGGPKYPAALVGKLSAGELANFIKQSMPPGPKKCPAPDADKIASYMFDAFYSPLAQERNRPARVELQRLTVRQFENAVADLIGNDHPAVPPTTQHGLVGQYFKGRSRDPKQMAFERTDPTVQFEFGTSAPAAKDIDPNNFSIAWAGSVLAPDTGEYEFSIHSRHSTQLWINNSRYPIVDGEVRSAKDADPKGTIKLLGGRAYNVYMVFTKATQGVDLKIKPKPTDSYVTLKWQRPNHAEEPIPAQFLYPQGIEQTYVVTTPFPPDDRSTGYERGDEVSKDWDDATTAAALAAADYVVAKLAEPNGIPANSKNREERLKQVCQSFLERAFRRPLTEDLKRRYIDKQFIVAPNFDAAVKRIVVLGLKSPRFLYREIGPQHGDPYVTASQLSFGLWDTIPDAELEKAAAEGRLKTRDQIMAQATRMSTDFRTWNKLRQFLLLWLKVDEVPDIVKDAKQYPSFDPSAVSDLRTSLELFLENTAWGTTSDFRDLMLSDTVYLDGRLAKLYGVDLPPDAPFQPIQLDPNERAGVLTQPYLLARFAYLNGSSPIHRGVLIERNFLGRTLRPPPANFVPFPASAHPDLTTRERVSLQTKPQFCANCHSIINPLGFTLERFDAIGKLRDKDNGKTINCTGAYRSRNGAMVRFSGAKDLAKYLATSDDSQSAFVEKLFVNIAKQSPMAFGPTKLDELERSFGKNQYSIRKLLVQMVTAMAMPDDNRMSSKGTSKP